jgi:hypothetical protein
MLCDYLSKGEMDLVLSATSIPSLSRLAATSKTYNYIVHRHIYDRLTTTIQPFFGQVTKCLTVLASTNTVISGSQALHFMMPPYEHNWGPADMDLYTSMEGYENLIAYMKSLGYGMVTNGAAGKQHRDYATEGNFGGIRFVTTMKKDGRQVDIIVSARTSPISPIFYFHSTIVTNFISAHGIFSAYPRLTEMYRGLVNPIAYAPRPKPTPKILGCMQKYRERGFEIRYNTTSWAISDATKAGNTIKEGMIPHDCHRSYMCPHTVRTTFDNSCMFVPFRTVEYMTKSREKKATHQAYKGRYRITWNIGGPSCDDTYDTMRSFVVSKGSSCHD